MCGTRDASTSTDDRDSVRGIPFIVISAGAISAALIAYVLDTTTPIDINRGAYAIAVSVFTVGACGWMTRCAEGRLRRFITAELDRKADQIAERIEKTVRDTPPSVTYLPGRARTEQPRMVAVGGEHDTVPLPTGVDPDTLAALRSIKRKLNGGEQQGRSQHN